MKLGMTCAEVSCFEFSLLSLLLTIFSSFWLVLSQYFAYEICGTYKIKKLHCEITVTLQNKFWSALWASVT